MVDASGVNDKITDIRLVGILELATSQTREKQCDENYSK
jgi:hypothetical protein